MGREVFWCVLGILGSLFLGILSEDSEDYDENEGVVLETPMGFLKGVEFGSVLNGSFFAFLGIPFAKPPIGHLRFMPPEPAEPWEGVREASTEPPKCAQIDPLSQANVGVEDCLLLDVFTPKHPDDLKNNRLPVIVIFHPGAFHSGSYTLETSGPDFLMAHDLVLVYVRYRLGIYGFLSFQDEILPGNAGMKDQVLALKWIRDNIGAFGGNRNLVTIAGVSAGAISAHYHMISPLSRGLFHRVISNSGSAIASFALAYHPKKNAEIMADVYNCSQGNMEILKCLQAVDINDLTVAQYNAVLLERSTIDSEVLPFAPCVEPKHANAFLVDFPYELLAKGEGADVPFMTGITSDELSILESLLSLQLLPEEFRRKALIEAFRNPEKMIPKRKPFVGTKRMAEAAVKFYFQDQQPSLHLLESVVKFSSDINFLMPLWDSLTLHMRHKKSSAYQYVFRHDTDYSYNRQLLSFAPPKGVPHGDFFYGYIMYNSENPVNPDHEAFQTFHRATKFWANFATYGDPTPDDSMGIQWLPTQLESRYYLDFGKNLYLRKDSQIARVTFWNQARRNESFIV